MGPMFGPAGKAPRRTGFWCIVAGEGPPLGSRRRALALIVVGGGVLTFFAPLVSTHPPVVQTTHWSPFNIVRQIYLGNLPQPICQRCGEPMVRSLLALPLDVTAVYVLMIVALVVLCFREGTAALARTALIGICFSLHTYMPRGGTNFDTKREFEWTFYGHPKSLEPSVNGPVFYGWLTVALLTVMVALVYIATREDFDAGTYLGE